MISESANTHRFGLGGKYPIILTMGPKDEASKHIAGQRRGRIIESNEGIEGDEAVEGDEGDRGDRREHHMGDRISEVLVEKRRRFGGAGFAPLMFLGIGVYRAWIELAFVGSFVDFPAARFNTHDLFDIVMSVTLVVCAFLAHRIGPFYDRKSVYRLCGATLVLSTVLMFSSVCLPGDALLLACTSSASGGFGIALMILIWSELYGCLNPLRVALCYSASIVLGALIIYVYRGFLFPWLFVMTALLPVVSLLMASRGFELLPAAERPSHSWSRFSVPWKVIFLMAIYAFAYGLMEGHLYSGPFGPHSAIGTVVIALVVIGGVFVRGGRFDFGIVYRLALPLMVGAFILLPTFGLIGSAWSNFCVTAGYTAFSILIMLILSNICYRYGVSAIWLFGIERGIRAIFMMLGRGVSFLFGTVTIEGVEGGTIVAFLTLFAVVAGTTILLSERELASKWGAQFLSGGTDVEKIMKRQELADRCDALAREHKLSAREQEVLLLLAQHKPVATIERELIIANGTVKAHIRHVYQKLGVHSRDELFALLGLDTSKDEKGAGPSGGRGSADTSDTDAAPDGDVPAAD